MDFRERVVLVTGAASGIGRALCRQLGPAGAHLGLVDRDEAGLERVRAELEAAGSRTALAVADVRKREAVRSAVASLTAAPRAGGRPHSLCRHLRFRDRR